MGSTIESRSRLLSLADGGAHLDTSGPDANPAQDLGQTGGDLGRLADPSYFFHANSFFAYFFYVDRRVIPRLRSAFSAFHAHSIPRSE